MNQKGDINTEQAILEAAERLFIEKGFGATSTTEIAKVVGCNQAMVHYYYRTKERLFEAIFESKAKLFTSSFLKIGSMDIPFMDKIKMIIEIHFDILHANPGLPLFFFTEFRANLDKIETIRESIREFIEPVYQKINTELKSEIKKGKIRNTELVDLIMTIASLNATLFIMYPIVKKITEMDDAEADKFLSHRKEENMRIILKSLEP